ncbi:hypothetical protein [Streptomyces sp. AC495_CC817]|uniref:hypothetical protein n=1 Tax=Streptomyces sp. AC495_CC817 TaxID=2823900 RepID=UPI001C258531|nr:hypothetical protein [Streptomyces sp. AC495_CC817]
MSADRWRIAAAATTTVFALALALVACAPTPGPVTTTSPSAAPSPTATSTEPRAAFDGDCGQVLADSAMSDGVGQTMNAWEPRWQDGANQTLGGVTCLWASEKYLSAFATVHVFPVEAIDPEYIESDAANGCAADAAECTTSGVFGDVWVAAVVRSDRPAEDVEGLASVVQDIGARAEAQPRPVPGARDGWWGPVPTCDDLQAGLVAGGLTATATEGHSAPGPEFAGGPLFRICTLTATIDGESLSTQAYLRAGAAPAVESALASVPDSRVEYEGRVFANAGEQYLFDGAAGVLIGAAGANLVELDRLGFDIEATGDAKVLAAVIDALS